MGNRLIAWVTIVLLMAAAVTAWGQGVELGPPAEEKVQEAEVKMLRATVRRQVQEIGQLRRRVEELTRRLEAAGVGGESEEAQTEGEVEAEEPASAALGAPEAAERTGAGPTTRGRVKKVLFVCEGTMWDGGRVGGEVLRAIDELEPGQSFNIFVCGQDGVTAFQEGFFGAVSAENRRRAEGFLRRWSPREGWLGEALRMALNYRPDLIVVASLGRVKDPEAVLATVRKANASGRARINTTLVWAREQPAEVKHFLWQLAKENGGTCLDAIGQEADEPVVPVRVVEPVKAEPVRRNALKVK